MYITFLKSSEQQLSIYTIHNMLCDILQMREREILNLSIIGVLTLVHLKIFKSVSSLPIPLIKSCVNSFRSLPNVLRDNCRTCGSATDRVTINSAMKDCLDARRQTKVLRREKGLQCINMMKMLLGIQPRAYSTHFRSVLKQPILGCQRRIGIGLYQKQRNPLYSFIDTQKDTHALP